ncbi:sulfotransferase domain-containing protein [Nisaea nitritireducens]|uniref:sulfotransferase domain-containing protein n=1 Tax=Nisaea nitritireducens TaxID=568392 RepID=UPI001D019C80|nr:sulfotransferase domain-containing protein [Nisaea nitritireducens]
MSRIIWLASYPKSGNTWMRALLANYLIGQEEPFAIEDLRAFSLSDVRPRFYAEVLTKPVQEMTAEESVTVRPQAQQRLAAARGHDHFVKTHSRFGMLNGTHLIDRSVSAGAVYIIRNPADIVPSYASHMGVATDAAIEIMADRDHATVEADVQILTPIGRWGDHAESWIDGSHSLPVCVVRYEDLYADPEKAFGQVLKVLGLPFDRERLARSIRHSSFEELSRQEKEKGFSERPPHMQRFFRSGGSGEGQQALSEGQLARLVRDHGPVMKRFGYLP